MSNARLEIAGYLGPQNVELWEGLQQKLRDAGTWRSIPIPRRCGSRGEARVPKVHRFVMCSDGVSRAERTIVLEAYAAGTPYLLPDHGAFPELNQRLKYGSTFKARDQISLASALAQSAAMHAMGQSLSGNETWNQHDALNEVDIARMAQRNLEILEKA